MNKQQLAEFFTYVTRARAKSVLDVGTLIKAQASTIMDAYELLEEGEVDQVATIRYFALSIIEDLNRALREAKYVYKKATELVHNLEEESD